MNLAVLKGTIECHLFKLNDKELGIGISSSSHQNVSRSHLRANIKFT